MNDLKIMIDDLGYDVMGLEKIVYATNVLAIAGCFGGMCDIGCKMWCHSCVASCAQAHAIPE